MNELQTLIQTLETQLAGLRQHADKDVAELRGEVTRVEAAVKAELAALVGKLGHL